MGFDMARSEAVEPTVFKQFLKHPANLAGSYHGIRGELEHMELSVFKQFLELPASLAVSHNL